MRPPHLGTRSWERAPSRPRKRWDRSQFREGPIECSSVYHSYTSPSSSCQERTAVCQSKALQLCFPIIHTVQISRTRQASICTNVTVSGSSPQALIAALVISSAGLNRNGLIVHMRGSLRREQAVESARLYSMSWSPSGDQDCRAHS